MSGMTNKNYVKPKSGYLACLWHKIWI